MSNPRSPNRAIRTVSSRLGKPWEGLPFRIGPVAKSDVERVPGAGEATRTVPSPERTARGRSSTFSRSRRVASRRWLVFRKRITARQPPSGKKYCHSVGLVKNFRECSTACKDVIGQGRVLPHRTEQG